MDILSGVLGSYPTLKVLYHKVLHLGVYAVSHYGLARLDPTRLDSVCPAAARIMVVTLVVSPAKHLQLGLSPLVEQWVLRADNKPCSITSW